MTAADFFAFFAVFFFDSSAARFLIVAAAGLSFSIALADLSGLHFKTAFAVPSFGALILLWTSSELMRRERSAFVIWSCGRRYGFEWCGFVFDGSL